MTTIDTSSVLIGNSFPLSLIRRSVRIEPISEVDLIATIKGGQIASFWGHSNTLAAVNGWLGLDLTPKSERPVLCLSENKLPQLDGVEYQACFIFSPDYRPGFRPAIGAEVDAANIIGWQILKIVWE
ncbi:MAG: hypothetical protein IKP00_00965 [Victivallales bacterium]|nr:hypothetical protein [Victivallales bacterium]